MAATMQKAQRIMLMVLPIVFIPFILNFPAGAGPPRRVKRKRSGGGKRR
jgi:hypothetical protein